MTGKVWVFSNGETLTVREVSEPLLVLGHRGPWHPLPILNQIVTKEEGRAIVADLLQAGCPKK